MAHWPTPPAHPSSLPTRRALTLNSVLSCAREWLLWLHNSQDNDKWPGKGKYEVWHTNRMALLRGAPWHVKAWRLSLSASIRGSLVLAGAVAMRKSPALLAQPPHAALVVVASASAVALVLAFPYHALHRRGVALLRAWPVDRVVGLRARRVRRGAADGDGPRLGGRARPSALKMQAPALCGCGEIVCSVADGGVAWCGLLGPYADGQPLALAVALIGGASLLSWLVQAAGYLGWSAPKPGERVGPCRRVGLVVCGGVRGWSDFWYARLDATVGGVILVALFALSFLPLSYLQSIVLYNRKLWRDHPEQAPPRRVPRLAARVRERALLGTVCAVDCAEIIRLLEIENGSHTQAGSPSRALPTPSCKTSKTSSLVTHTPFDPSTAPTPPTPAAPTRAPPAPPPAAPPSPPPPSSRRAGARSR